MLVPTHKGYIGGDFYFDEALSVNSIAHSVHVSVPDSELGVLRQPAGPQTGGGLLANPGIATLRRAILTFVVGGTTRHLDEEGNDIPERLFSFIVHIDRLKGAHSGQRAVAQALIEELKKTDPSLPILSTQVDEAYKDVAASRIMQELPSVSIAQVRSKMKSALASIAIEVVNGENDWTRLLDDNGQLKQSNPFNIYIGGQALDRGVTIENVIGFYYGRDPRTAQQDTTIQHCRMYGDRSRADLAVTRLYTSDNIYSRMRRMHEFDKALWSQIRKKNQAGSDTVVAGGDVLFLRRDTGGSVSPCSPNKIMLSRLVSLTPGGEVVPWPLTTRDDEAHAVTPIITRLEKHGMNDKKPFEVPLRDAMKVIEFCSTHLNIDDGWDFDWEAMRAAVEFLAGSHPDPTKRNRVACLVSLGNSIKKWKDAAETDPQRAPYSAATETAVRTLAGRSPALAFYENQGLTKNGWSGKPFLWPVLFVPDQIPPVIFSNNRRRPSRAKA